MEAGADQVRRMIDEVLDAGRAVSDHVATLTDDETLVSTPEWREFSLRSRQARDRLAVWLADTGTRLGEGDRELADAALTYLEADPYYFRSGYDRNRLAGRLARAPLGGTDRIRAQGYVLSCVDGTRHCSRPALGRLARSVTDNPLRRDLRHRLHATGPGVAERALSVILAVRRPGLDAGDLDAARRLVVAAAGRDEFLRPDTERRARRLWSPEWQADLVEASRHHGPDRTGSRRLLEAADVRRARRPGP